MTDFSKIPTTLDVSLYGNLETLTDTLSKCRVRIFYKGMNRNRTFISEDFANQLINSLPYTPVKGIFDKEKVDYQDHGEDNTDGRVYGVVMAEPNFAWEAFEDEDGVTRTYACADVLLFTGLYPEARLVPGESQSMEIFRNTLKGEWRIWKSDGMPYYHFLEGSLVGLQVLGQETEPCFEGAAFFNLYKDVKEMVDYIKTFSKKEDEEMTSEEEVKETVETAAEEFTVEETETTTEETAIEEAPVEEPVEEVAAENFVEETTEEVPTENSIEEAAEEESVEETDSFSVEEKNSLEEKITALESEKTAFESKIAELEASLTAANEKISAFESEKNVLESQFSDIKSENESLNAFKKTVETEKKEEILTKYEEHLSESAVAAFKDSIDNYSVEDFKKEVCTAAVESDPTIFSREKEPMFFKGENTGSEKGESGIMRLLNNYKYGGNK